MAQSGYTPISLYYTTTAAAVPTSGNLVNGELAINITDGKLYYKNNSGVVTLLAGSTSGPAGGSTTQVQYNNAGVLAGITGATTNGTALTLVAPVLGTPASGLATNLTGLPLTTGVTGTLPVANGGTGLTAGTSGGLLAYTATGTLASSALLTLYGVVYGGGVGAVPVATAAGTTGQVLQATTGGAPVWGSTYAGSVSSVGFTGGLISVATATTTPALTVAGTSGGVVYFSSASTWASSALLSANSLMIGGGSGAAPATTTTGTGVVTALGVNTGTAGAFVVNGGALGSPSSAGTIPAFTLGGTVAGGGNQLNNVIIGTTTPLAGAFTTLSASSGNYTSTGGFLLGADIGATTVTNSTRKSGVIAVPHYTNSASKVLQSWVDSDSTANLIYYGGGLGGFNAATKHVFKVGATTTTADGTEVANISSTGLAVTGTLTSTLDATIYGVTVGRGGGAVSTNTAVGASALAATATGGFNSTFGYQAGQSITSGSSNTAIGYQANKTNITGDQVTAVGSLCLSVNTASNNTAVGFASMNGNTSGSGNTALGWYSLYSNTTASGSTAVGYRAGYTNTGIVTAFGYQAGYSQTTNASFQNSFFGYEAGFFATGAGHTAVGQNALRAMTTANWSTAVGYGALAADTGGTNTAVGASAAISTTGAGNSVVGWQALNTNISGTDNVAVGSNALFTTTAGSQVAVGSRAAYARTTATGETYASTFIGTQAGSGTTTGIELTFIGGFAGRYHTGNYNTAVGTAALYGASGTSTGTNNTALGYVSLFGNTSGANNTAVGHAAGYSNTDGASNVLIGYNAGYSNTKGYGTVAIGIEAAYATTRATIGYTGIIAIGTAALKANNTGGPNIAIGGYDAGNIEPALFKNTSGSYNIALGTGALSNNLTASNLTAVGYQAGYAITASNNTFIGYKAGYLATTGGDNTIIGVSTPSGLTTGSNNVGLGGLSTYYTFNLTTESNRLIVGHSLISNAYVQVAWTVVSDARDKTDVATTSYGLDFVNELKPIQYRWDKRSHYDNGQPDGSKKENKLQLGFLAQDVIALEKKYGATEKDLLIADDEQDDSLKVTETKMIPALVKAIQELNAKFEEYKSTHP